LIPIEADWRAEFVRVALAKTAAIESACELVADLLPERYAISPGGQG